MTAVWLLFFAGCINEIKRDALDFPDNPTEDYDGDGLTEQQGDCNDLDDDVEAATTWYLDSDGDGFGDANVSTDACEQPSDHVGNSDDCNDSDAAIFPDNARYEADDLCVVDADGDGYGDALPPVSADAGSDCDDTNPLVYPGYNEEAGTLCVLDSDGDGFGQINAPQPYDPGTDCDDSNGAVFPDADEVCDGVDNDCSGEVDDYNGVNAPLWFVDADGDGFGRPLDGDGDGLDDDHNGDGLPDNVLRACNQPMAYVDNDFDCDDTRSDVYPNAPELCVDGDADGDGLDDAVDNDCDGTADEEGADGVLIWYADADGDGFGDSSAVRLACEQPSGYLSDGSDCNDNNVNVHPAADEYCNQVDDDCDGSIDEAALDTFSWYADSDADGFGTPLLVVDSCTQPVGFVSDASDCDDGSAEVRPNAAEYCNNRDDNCDGNVDEAAVDAMLFYFDGDGDGHGIPGQSVIACPDLNGVSIAPPDHSVLDDDCDDTTATVSPSANESCTATIDENCDGHPTLGAVDQQVWYADFDDDGQGSPVYVIETCSQPFGYVDNALDCNDSDPDVLSGMPVSWEICNGKLDRCEDDDGLLTVPSDERDLDNDNYVACDLGGLDPLLWADQGAGVLGGNDCEDDDPLAFPGAPEVCNGVVDGFNGDGFCNEPVPDDEIDDDNDGYVECSHDPATWEGGFVLGGDDCDDTRDFIYTGAAINSPDVCAQDLDGDGDPDCNLTGIHPDYLCAYGVIPSVGLGPDFVLVPAGNDPLGRYTISFDLYVMTTEVTEGLWDTVTGGSNVTSLQGKGDLSFHQAAEFANSLSDLHGFESCYDCVNGDCTEAMSPTTCFGYRLPTSWEWEYAARAGTTAGYWTGQGTDSGGDGTSNQCDGTALIWDGVNNPPIGDYAWYCANSQSAVQVVAQKQPNGFGLFDVHGNLYEWTADYSDSNFLPSGVDPWNGNAVSTRIMRGGSSNSHSLWLRSDQAIGVSHTYAYYTNGIRLVRRVP